MSIYFHQYQRYADDAQQLFAQTSQAIQDSLVYTGVSRETPLTMAPRLSARYNHRILMKREDLQVAFSFKTRGAGNMLSKLAQTQEITGVVAASAGNHAQGVARAAASLGIPAVIVMPLTTPDTKVQAVNSIENVEALLHGNDYDAACLKVADIIRERNWVEIPPYDHLDVIAGQGTTAKEILADPAGADINTIFVPIGGGGLAAGVIAYLRHNRPEIQIIGVESEDSACALAALRAGTRVELNRVGLFADGVAVKEIGRVTWPYIQAGLDALITVSTDEICAAVQDLFDEYRVIAEPAGALTTAAIRKWVEGGHTKPNDVLAAFISGANTNFTRLGHIVERAELGTGREQLLAVSLDEKPGSFLKFCKALDTVEITEFNYRLSDECKAEVFVGLRSNDEGDDQPSVVSRLQEQQYDLIDLSHNNLARTHLRHMVGGRGVSGVDERVFSTMLLARPGALQDFLTELGARWNITLFHFRNHGAAYFRILVGLQGQNSHEIEQHLATICVGGASVVFTEETGNKAYQKFLA